MLDYEEELKKFKPSLEVDDIENAVYQEDLTVVFAPRPPTMAFTCPVY